MRHIRNSNFNSKVTFNVWTCLNVFAGRSQIRAIKSTIVKTTVCQNGGASLLIIDKNVWPTEKQQAWAYFYCWRLLANSERRHIYFRSYPNGHKLNKFLHLVAKRQMHFVLTFGRTSGGWGVACIYPNRRRGVYFIFRDPAAALYSRAASIRGRHLFKNHFIHY